jgi:hypothetical protein
MMFPIRGGIDMAAKLKNGIYTEPQNPTPAQQKRKIKEQSKVREAYERIAEKSKDRIQIR